MRRVAVVIHGRVQGVFFRKNIYGMALAYGLKGYVKNLPDRTVQAVFEGDDAAVKKMIAYCKRGPFLAKVKDIKVKEEPYLNEFSGFEIRY
jgi:acylphosphatase